MARAAAALAAGGLVILPTDTVYGIAADARQDDAVRALYAAKGKGAESPLQLLFSADHRLLERYASLTPSATALIAGLGSGGWTLVVPAAAGWDSPALAGGRTVGVRIPASRAVAEVVDRLGAPLAASSANRHGKASPRTCAEAMAGVGRHCTLALDAGTTSGVDSTVIDCVADPPRILREGAIDRPTIARILGITDIQVLRSVRP